MYDFEELQETKTEINYFGKWIKSLSVEIYPEIRKKVIGECKITTQIYRNWKCGITEVPPLAREKVIEIAGYDIFKPTENEQQHTKTDNRSIEVRQ